MDNSPLRVAYPGNSRYPDPAVEVLDPAFLRYRIFSASVEQLGSGLRWAEGPVWFGDGRYLLLSDIPTTASYAGTRRPARCRCFAIRRITRMGWPATARGD